MTRKPLQLKMYRTKGQVSPKCRKRFAGPPVRGKEPPERGRGQMEESNHGN